MSFKNWKIWLGSLPWELKWFPILVVIRPVVDQFWELKHISPLVSPLYWVGILTPVLCLIGLRKFKAHNHTLPSRLFRNWSIFAIVNGILIIIDHSNLNYFILILKITLPVYLFFFLRVFIVSKIDLMGILTSFLYSWGIVCALFIYELIFGARSIEVTRGSLERWEGGFADVLNYAIYSIAGFIVLTYFFFQKKEENLFKKLIPTLVGLGVSMLIITKIHHTTSLLCIVALIALSLFRIFGQRPSIGIVFVLITITLYSVYGSQYKSKTIDPLLRHELYNYEHRKDAKRRQFNGRMGRWMDRVSEFKRGNIPGKFLGSGIGFFSSSSIIGIAVHNDFLRITFFTGFVGIFFYILFYLGLFTRRRFLEGGDKFLLEACLLLIGLYSITTLPTMYAPLMYITMTVFCYVSLPDEILLNDEFVEEEAIKE